MSIIRSSTALPEPAAVSIIRSSTELAACGRDHHPIVDSTLGLRPRASFDRPKDTDLGERWGAGGMTKSYSCTAKSVIFFRVFEVTDDL